MIPQNILDITDFKEVPIHLGSNEDFIVTSIGGRENIAFYPREMGSEVIAHNALAHFTVREIADKVFNFSDPNCSAEKLQAMIETDHEKTAEALAKVLMIIGSHYNAAVEIADEIKKLKRSKNNGNS